MAVLRLIVEILVVVLVVARISRLGAQDVIMEPFRNAAARRLPKSRSGGPHLLARGLFCRWCWSVWAAIVVAPTWWMISDTPHVWDRWYVDLPALVLALSQAAALVEAKEPED